MQGSCDAAKTPVRHLDELLEMFFIGLFFGAGRSFQTSDVVSHGPHTNCTSKTRSRVVRLFFVDQEELHLHPPVSRAKKSVALRRICFSS